jgi:glycosyltransferase involved in cell wall biosynthesis
MNMPKGTSNSKLHILLLGTQMAVGGAQRVLLDQADWFHSHGHTVAAAFLYDRDGLHAEWQNGRAYPLYNLEANKPGAGILRQAFSLWHGLVSLWQLLRRERFDVIETFTFDSNIPGMLLSWLAGVPLRIATHHGKVRNVTKWQELLHLVIAKNTASIIVAVSAEVRDDLVARGIDPAKIVVIPNGIGPYRLNAVDMEAVRHEFKPDRGKTILVSVGRLVYQKAHSVLINAMQLVLGSGFKGVLYIAGEGPLRKDLEEQICDLGLLDQVRLLGNRNDIPALLSIADIFVLPSRWEGLPMALLEGMGAGLPVVATNVEGVVEVVQNHVQGVLVPPEDAKTLAEALSRLMSNAKLRKTMGIQARKRVQKFYTTDIMCENYLKIMINGLALQNGNEALGTYQ